MHTPAPASRRLRRLLTAVLTPLLLAAVAGVVLLYPTGGLPDSMIDSGTPIDGTITAVTTGGCTAEDDEDTGDGGVDVDTSPDSADEDADEQRCYQLDVRLDEGPAAGTSIRKYEPADPASPRFAAGDPVVLNHGGGDAADANSYQVADFQRGMPLVLLAALFAIAVIVLGRWQGLRALASLGIAFGVIALFVLPAILDGANPVYVGIAGAGVIMFATLYLTHGFSAMTSVAVIGTLISLVLIGVISAVFSGVTRLTGLDEQTSTLIAALGHGIDARGLLLAGVIIGALGVLDDVTVTQASAVWQLHHANPTLRTRQLYTSALRIGKDHVGSAVNTLVLAYTGAALPVLLYSAISGVGIGTVLGSQDIAQEILRTLAGSIGIVAAVPVTTLVAAIVVTRDRAPATSS